ncbi:MAG: transcription antitermination factor NusB [Phycisphaerales bacterium]|nr:transcription antitermination factor NusB [Phycisphaerales bacterium]
MSQVSEQTSRSTHVSPARAAVLPHLEAKARRFPELFPDPMDVSRLSPRDARLATTIDREVTARWSTLRAILEPRLNQPWNQQQPAVLAALMGGAAQLLFMDRVPDHAAIGESVGWCKSTAAARASGVVNAVLRRVAGLRAELLERVDMNNPAHLLRSDGTGWRLSEPIFDGTLQHHVAQQTGCNDAFLEEIARTDGPEEAMRLALHAMARPPVILHGAGEHDALEAHESPGFQVLRPGSSLADVFEQYPDAIVQDPTAAAACAATSATAPQCIVDVCAGRGTKTRQLAAIHTSARIIASDISPGRMLGLHDLADTHQQIEACPAKELIRHAGTVDLLVLDVPCSNSGVLARRVEARHRQDPATRRRLGELQRQIAADSLALLAPGGTLLWTTCSIHADENERQVEWLTKWHDLELALMHRELGRGAPGEPAMKWRDGGFFALLRKPASND